MTILTLGMVGMADKLGGLALGLILGVAISGALVIGTARLTYNFDFPGEELANRLAAELVQTVESNITGEDLKEQLSKQISETAGEKGPQR